MIGAMHPCFSAPTLGSNGRNRVFLGGADGEELGGRPFVLVFDGDGQPLDQIALHARDARVTGVAGTRDTLLVTGPRGLLRYSIAKTVPDGTAAVHCTLITPVMHSPGREIHDAGCASRRAQTCPTAPHWRFHTHPRLTS